MDIAPLKELNNLNELNLNYNQIENIVSANQSPNTPKMEPDKKHPIPNNYRLL